MCLFFQFFHDVSVLVIGCSLEHNGILGVKGGRGEGRGGPAPPSVAQLDLSKQQVSTQMSNQPNKKLLMKA